MPAEVNYQGNIFVIQLVVDRVLVGYSVVKYRGHFKVREIDDALVSQRFEVERPLKFHSVLL